jgi:uncharacterized membrane protein
MNIKVYLFLTNLILNLFQILLIFNLVIPIFKSNVTIRRSPIDMKVSKNVTEFIILSERYE